MSDTAWFCAWLHDMKYGHHVAADYPDADRRYLVISIHVRVENEKPEGYYCCICGKEWMK